MEFGTGHQALREVWSAKLRGGDFSGEGEPRVVVVAGPQFLREFLSSTLLVAADYMGLYNPICIIIHCRNTHWPADGQRFLNTAQLLTSISQSLPSRMMMQASTVPKTKPRFAGMIQSHGESHTAPRVRGYIIIFCQSTKLAIWPHFPRHPYITRYWVVISLWHILNFSKY